MRLERDRTLSPLRLLDVVRISTLWSAQALINVSPLVVRDVQGLRLSPDMIIAKSGLFDVLLVPGGHGQQALMHDEDVLDLIRRHVESERLLFSVAVCSICAPFAF